MAKYNPCVIYGIIIDKETADILEDTNYHIFEEQWCCGKILYLGYKLGEINLNNDGRMEFYPDVHREIEFYKWAKEFLNPNVHPTYYVIF